MKKLLSLGVPAVMVGALVSNAEAKNLWESDRVSLLRPAEESGTFGLETELDETAVSSALLNREEQEEFMILVDSWIHCDLIVRGGIQDGKKAKRSLSLMLESLSERLDIEVLGIAGQVSSPREEQLLLVLHLSYHKRGYPLVLTFDCHRLMNIADLPHMREQFKQWCISCDIPDLPFEEQPSR